MLGQYDDRARRLVERVRCALVEPHHRGQGVGYCHRVDVVEIGGKRRRQGSVLDEAERVTDILRTHGDAVMPLGARIDVKGDVAGIRSPAPPIGQSGCEANVAHGVQRWTDIGEVVEDLIDNLLPNHRDCQRRKKNVGIGRRGHNDRSAHALLARARADQKENRERDRANATCEGHPVFPIEKVAKPCGV